VRKEAIRLTQFAHFTFPTQEPSSGSIHFPLISCGLRRNIHLSPDSSKNDN
jgi:hypothetical protein